MSQFSSLVMEWARNHVPSPMNVAHHLLTILPLPLWILSYRLSWIMFDALAGLTTSLVVIPQSLAFGYLARLSPEHGIYSAFIGMLVYWLLGSSKDMVVSATAMSSLLIRKCIRTTISKVGIGIYTLEEIASAITLLSGLLLLIMGVMRLGWLAKLIPNVAVTAFSMAVSLKITISQLPIMLGISNISGPSHIALIKIIRNIHHMKIDAVFGISTIVLLAILGRLCTMVQRKQPGWTRFWATMSTFRLPVTVGTLTLVSFLIKRSHDTTSFNVLGYIDLKLQRLQVPGWPDVELIKAFASQIPAIVTIMFIGQIALAERMAMLSGAKANASQELVALGAVNVFSPFAGGYLCMSSTSGSTILAKAGSKSPLAGIFGAILIYVAITCLAEAFAYIPTATLAGTIVYSMSNGIIRPRILRKYWRVSPFTFGTWIICVVAALMYSIEWAVYLGMIFKALQFFYRIGTTPGEFAKIVRVKPQSGMRPESTSANLEEELMFLPLNQETTLDPNLQIEDLYPGVFAYRFVRGFYYMNHALHTRILSEHIRRNTQSLASPERLWNEPRRTASEEKTLLPHFRAIVLDFGTVDLVDWAAMEELRNLRDAMNRYTEPEVAEWHFANVQDNWVRRALITAGFGRETHHADLLDAVHVATQHAREKDERRT